MSAVAVGDNPLSSIIIYCIYLFIYFFKSALMLNVLLLLIDDIIVFCLFLDVGSSQLCNDVP